MLCRFLAWLLFPPPPDEPPGEQIWLVFDRQLEGPVAHWTKVHTVGKPQFAEPDDWDMLGRFATEEAANAALAAMNEQFVTDKDRALAILLPRVTNSPETPCVTR